MPCSNASLEEDFSPIYVGDDGAVIAPQFLHKDDSPVQLTGVVIGMKMQNINTGVVKICTGTWAIDDPLKGTAHYLFQPTDVDTVGIWKLYITLSISGRPVHADERLLEIRYAP